MLSTAPGRGSKLTKTKTTSPGVIWLGSSGQYRPVDGQSRVPSAQAPATAKPRISAALTLEEYHGA